MKRLTFEEIWQHHMGGDRQYVSFTDAKNAAEQYRDQELAILREFHKQQLEQEYIKGWNDSLNHYNINRI